MRVCLVAHRFYEFNTHMRQFATAFVRRGDVVDVIGVGREGAPRYEAIDGVNVYRIQVRNIDERGPIDYLTKMVIFALRAARFLAFRHLKCRYDLIHVQSVPDFLVFSAIVPKITGTPVILDLRDLVPELYISRFSVPEQGMVVRLLKLMEKLSAAFSDHVIVANPIWYERIVGRSAKRSKSSMFWYYPDLTLFHRKPEKAHGEKFVIMYPGTLNWHQGLDIAIRAFPGILREIPEAELRIQGDGAEKVALMALARNLGLQEKVRFLDLAPISEVVESMAEADVALVPKRGSGFGNEAASTKISEFMAMGIPVVAAKTEIESRFFDDSVVRYFRPEDEQDLAEAVVSIYRDPILRDQLVHKSLGYVEKNNWHLKIHEYLDIVASLTQSPLRQELSLASDVSKETIESPLADRYRCDLEGVKLVISGVSGRPGYFRFGSDTICYGRCSTKTPLPLSHDADLSDEMSDVDVRNATVVLPFDPKEVVDNLRCEKYVSQRNNSSAAGVLNGVYYSIRGALPTKLRRRLQKAWLADWQQITFPKWPVDTTVEQLTEKLLILALQSKSVASIPFIWFWPKGHLSCVTITHDVEGITGRDFCDRLMDTEEAHDVRSSFQIIPEGPYSVPNELLSAIRDRGFEINVHDLNHDGFLFREQGEFSKRAASINGYAKLWGALGFRAAVMYHALDWYAALDFQYDMSVPNVSHLEPQRGGCCTVFPYFVGDVLEIPLTTIQDYALFHYLGEYSPALWKSQVDVIRSRNGLASFLTHPDYIFEGKGRAVYLQLLEYLCELRDSENVWLTLPAEINAWWRARNKMQLVLDGSRWTIEGPGHELARVAHARLEEDKLVFEIEGQPPFRSPFESIEQPSRFFE